MKKKGKTERCQKQRVPKTEHKHRSDHPLGRGSTNSKQATKGGRHGVRQPHTDQTTTSNPSPPSKKTEGYSPAKDSDNGGEDPPTEKNTGGPTPTNLQGDTGRETPELATPTKTPCHEDPRKGPENSPTKQPGRQERQPEDDDRGALQRQPPTTGIGRPQPRSTQPLRISLTIAL
ncbi:hypothetical protein RND81_01G108500 [Saponaria officinalis]|uniref:Uncharacterized protein n=1 Tax=Saponaria officinalis TaxID=3572 RepID=A0AAW1N6Y9_SAPOF